MTTPSRTPTVTWKPHVHSGARMMDEIPSKSNTTCYYYSSADSGPQVKTIKLSTRER